MRANRYQLPALKSTSTETTRDVEERQVKARNFNMWWVNPDNQEQRLLAKTCTLITYKISIGYQISQPEKPICRGFDNFVSYLYPLQPTAC
jgi:hypothetical protein